MAEITTKKIAEDGKGWRFEVEVKDDQGATLHFVGVPRELHERITRLSVLPERLVRESFDFLLDREPKESILRRFDLSIIEQFFPEYEAEMRKRLMMLK